MFIPRPLRLAEAWRLVPTHPLPRAAISWSGGKDSCAALMRARDAFDVVTMVTMFDEDALRSRSHGLRPEVLAAQADRLGLDRVIGRCNWQSYDRAFSDALATLASDGITHVVFGDILFEEHRRWAERMCAPHGSPRSNRCGALRPSRSSRTGSRPALMPSS